MRIEGFENYDIERAAILSTAVGIARVYLKNGRYQEAQDVLDNAANRTHALLHDALVASGMTKKQVDEFIGFIKSWPRGNEP